MWKKFIIDAQELHNGITEKTVDLAQEFGKYLVEGDGKVKEPLTTSQLRKFFGEVKRQQLKGYSSTSFIMLKPKLAYAVGRAKQKAKKEVKDVRIEDFYNVISLAIDEVVKSPENEKEKVFKNFIAVFEAIVAYHKVAEEDKNKENKNKKN